MVVVSKRLFDANEAAAYLSISRSKLYQWKSRISHINIDSKLLFDVDDLDNFVNNLKKGKNYKKRDCQLG